MNPADITGGQNPFVFNTAGGCGEEDHNPDCGQIRYWTRAQVHDHEQ
jgi:hypothetical protein